MRVNKLFLSSVLTLSLYSMAYADSGLFVGVNVGVPITVPEYQGQIANSSNLFPTSGIGWAVGAEVGYKLMFGNIIGLRVYADYYYNQSYGDKLTTSFMNIPNSSLNLDATITQHLINANIDFLFNPLSGLGIYIGIGLGWQGYAPAYTYNANVIMNVNGDINNGLKGGFSLPINMGLNFNFGSHTVSLGAKIPTLGYDYAIDSGGGLVGGFLGNGTVGLRTYIVKVGYSYTF